MIEDEPPTAEAATEALARRPTMDAEARRLLQVALQARDLQVQGHAATEDERASREAEVASALAALRDVPTAAELLDRACPAVVERCGFERAMLSRTDGRRWLPWKARFARDDDFERRFLAELQRGEILLADAPLEAGVVADRRPAIVLDPQIDPRTHKPVVELGLTRSYVVAPIAPGGRVVGFLHADHHPSDRVVDEDDRDALWAFAEGFGRLYERAVLTQRLAEQRREVDRAFSAAREAMEQLALDELALVDVEGDPLPAPAPRAAPAANEAVRALMTAREREVLDLLVRGAPNREIADQLVVSVGTVKTHVKAILRKVGASNRSEVIALYHRSGD